MVTLIMARTVSYNITGYEMFGLFDYEYQRRRVDSVWENMAQKHRP